MNITQLLYFVNVVTYDFNISTAANKLHVSQSTISKAVNAFEAQEGVALFVRHGRRVIGLTARGKTFYRDAKRILRDYERMLANLHHASRFIGTIKLGIAPAVYEALFPRVLVPFEIDHPDIRTEIQVLGSEELQDQMVLGNLDLAYTINPVKYDVLKTVHLINSHAAIIFNPDFFQLTPNYPLSALAKLKMVLLDHSFTLRNQVDALFSYAKETPDVVCDSRSETFLINACRFNRVVTILPESIISGYNMEGLTAVPFQQIDWQLLALTMGTNPNPIVGRVQRELNQRIRALGPRAENNE